MKQFKAIEDLEMWLTKAEDDLISQKEYDDPWGAVFERSTGANAEILAKKLEDEGYDLDDLVADGHAYELFGHKNNGWLWEDEADLEYIKQTGSKTELRKREEENIGV